MRKSISKKKRFAVFERDKFTCQYCWKNPIDHNVVLEIDHCVSVKNGWWNDLENLITSCFDCNRWKSKKTVILNQETNVEEIKEEQKKLEERLNQIKFIKEIKKKIKKTKKEIEELDYRFVDEILKWCYDDFIKQMKTRIKTQHTKYWIELYVLEDCLDITNDKFWDDEFYTRDFIKYFYGVLRNKIDNYFN